MGNVLKAMGYVGLAIGLYGAGALSAEALMAATVMDSVTRFALTGKRSLNNRTRG